MLDYFYCVIYSTVEDKKQELHNILTELIKITANEFFFVRCYFFTLSLICSRESVQYYFNIFFVFNIFHNSRRNAYEHIVISDFLVIFRLTDEFTVHSKSVWILALIFKTFENCLLIRWLKLNAYHSVTCFKIIFRYICCF